MNDTILGYLESSLTNYLAELEVIVNQDSGLDDIVGINKVNDWLQAKLQSIGFAVERNQSPDAADDLIARRRGTGNVNILILGHTDTVFTVGTASERPMQVSNNKILGPGVCDMKGGLLTGLYALQALDYVDWSDYGTITFLMVSDEESSERHSIDLLKREGERHDAILTLEAARENGDIVTARKAVAWFTVEANGKAAHAGVEPEKGRSAALAISRLVAAACELNGMHDGMTINPGVVKSGTTPNVVAERAIARFDLRAWTTAGVKEMEQALRDLVATEWVPDVTMQMQLEPGSDSPAMERTAGVQALESLAISIAHDLGFELRGAATGGGSDISFASHAGTPGLDGLGPIGGLDHSPDEYILLDSIVPRTALLAKLMMALSEWKESGGDTHA